MNGEFKGLSVHEALLYSGSVHRYHHHFPRVIGHQTVAEHTFRAMAILVSLWPEEATESALIGLLTHDGAEGAVGDISSAVKKMYPGIGDGLDAIEDAIMEGLGVTPTALRDGRTRLLIRLCDWMEGVFFALDQIAIGNDGMRVPHNAYVHALNILIKPAEDEEKIGKAHWDYMRRYVPREKWGHLDLLTQPLAE